MRSLRQDYKRKKKKGRRKRKQQRGGAPPVHLVKWLGHPHMSRLTQKALAKSHLVKLAKELALRPTYVSKQMAIVAKDVIKQNPMIGLKALAVAAGGAIAGSSLYKSGKKAIKKVVGY